MGAFNSQRTHWHANYHRSFCFYLWYRPEFSKLFTVAWLATCILRGNGRLWEYWLDFFKYEYATMDANYFCYLQQTLYVKLMTSYVRFLLLYTSNNDNHSTSIFDLLQNALYKMLPTRKFKLVPSNYILLALYEELSTMIIFLHYNKHNCTLQQIPTLYNKSLYEVHSTKLRPTN